MHVRIKLDANVFDLAIERLAALYREGHRVVYSFSAGKDSGVMIECGIVAAAETGNLPIDVVMRDEEIMYPGTYEYAERIAARPEVRFHWLYACQPIINVFNRAAPYWWVFDPELPREKWVRTPPPFARKIADLNIQRLISREAFPPAQGKDLYVAIGLRADESQRRLFASFAAGGHLTKGSGGIRGVRPIYDWTDSDVWRAVKINKWDYNRAYDTMLKMRVPRASMRIAPPTMNLHSLELLKLMAGAYPKWFDRVRDRIAGIKTAVQFGRRSCEPDRRKGESWKETFERECIEKAPKWIAERAAIVRDGTLAIHARHATGGLPETSPCQYCGFTPASWKALAQKMYNGDPFALYSSLVPYVEPEFFRKGAGTWGGKPSW